MRGPGCSGTTVTRQRCREPQASGGRLAERNRPGRKATCVHPSFNHHTPYGSMARIHRASPQGEGSTKRAQTKSLDSQDTACDEVGKAKELTKTPRHTDRQAATATRAGRQHRKRGSKEETHPTSHQLGPPCGSVDGSTVQKPRASHTAPRPHQKTVQPAGLNTQRRRLWRRQVPPGGGTTSCSRAPPLTGAVWFLSLYTIMITTVANIPTHSSS